VGRMISTSAPQQGTTPTRTAWRAGQALLALAILGGALLAASPAGAQQDSNQALIDLLVRKGVLTAEDVASLRQELAAQKAQATASPAPAPEAPPPQAPAPAMVAAVVSSGTSPLSFKIGAADFTPFGFVDFTSVYRSTDVGSGISTNFAGIPYNNTSAGQLSESRLSAQNSRLGLRVDSTVDDTKVLGYIETDFLGNAASTINVNSNSATLRMRLYFADFKSGDWEFLAGQSWSMLTPDRVGISPIPSDLFYTLNMDIAYQAGLVWARQPQLRAVYHGPGGVTAGLSLENPDQYVGGANGAPSVTLPAAFNGAEVDSGTASTSPNEMPDVIAKLAYDTRVNGLPWHAEIAGVYRTFKINTFTVGPNPVNSDSTATGVGGSFNMDLELLRGLSLVGNGYVSDGGGRYIFGQAPDFVVSPPDGSGASTISLERSWSFITGLEWKAAPQTTLFGYYSEIGIGRDYAPLVAGGYVGYGYPGSPNSQNKSIDEYTLGAVQTLWKDPAYGALQVIAQASYLDRKPWYVANGAPGDAHVGMFFLDLRYILP
jgi:hypothetical protein